MAADDAMIDLAGSPKRAPDASALAEQKPASAISAFDPFVAGASPAPKADAAGSSSLGMPAEIAAAFEANKASSSGEAFRPVYRPTKDCSNSILFWQREKANFVQPPTRRGPVGSELDHAPVGFYEGSIQLIGSYQLHRALPRFHHSWIEPDCDSITAGAGLGARAMCAAAAADALTLPPSSQASAQPTTSPDALMQAILEDAKRMREQSGSKGDDPFAGME
ncbi:unnamed protein product [Prorocentrum cordatum]|uniref:Uncharacterized protein n=1 Tax=Prorocentrum cordatum TaxID=2364126 RepID=A0ABN9UMH2_9DINO|nr:unnamed protein product [Polarella glacialis]